MFKPKAEGARYDWMDKKTMSTWDSVGGHHAWTLLERGVDKLSVTQTAAIGGTGSVVSLATASAPDFTVLNAYLQTAALGAGALGAVLSVGLILLKGWLELRNRKPPA